MSFLKKKILLLVIWCLHAGPEVAANPERRSEIRIVDGREVRQGEIAFQLSLQSEDGYHFCGASLAKVDDIQFGISASHCFLYGPSMPIYVVAGEVDLMKVSGAEQKRLLTRVVIHPEFGVGAPIANDIALLFWEEPFDLNNNVSTIRLPTPSHKETSKEVDVSGWGRLSHQGPSPNHLQAVKILVIPDTVCKAAWNQDETWVLDSMLCAGTTQGKQSPCNGDSGGPAKDLYEGFLVGIVSFGMDCSSAEKPAVFTEVAYYVKWIEEQVKSQQMRMLSGFK